MKIVFMGTPDFAVPCLERIISDGHEILGVFTQPDKPKGRGYKLIPPPVKEVALKHQLPIYQPVKLRDSDAYEVLKKLNPDLIVVVAYGQILPKNILDLPKYGCINVHGSLLPRYRGAAPIQWSVINGDEFAGVTTMYMAEGLDTGDMLLKTQTPIGENETTGELYERLAVIGADCLSDTIKLLQKDGLTPVKQDDSQSSYACMLNKQMGKLSFSKPAKQVHNLIRGLSPWPGAYTSIDGKILKIHRARVADAVNFANAEPGTLLDKKRFIVACSDGAIEFLEVQLEGKSRMDAKAFLNGKKLNVGYKLI